MSRCYESNMSRADSCVVSPVLPQERARVACERSTAFHCAGARSVRCLPPPSSPPHPDCLAMQGDARRVAPETAASARATSLEMSRRSERESSRRSDSSRRSESGESRSPSPNSKRILARHGTFSGGEMSPSTKQRLGRQRTSNIQAADRKRFNARVVRRVHALMLADYDVRVKTLLCFPLVHTCL